MSNAQTPPPATVTPVTPPVSTTPTNPPVASASAPVSSTPPVAKPPFVYNTLTATQKLAEVVNFYVAFHGKPKCNPHFYLKAEVLPLKGLHESPDAPKTEELFQKIMALKCDEANVVAKDGKYYGNRTVIQPAIAGLATPALRSHEVKQHANNTPPVTFNPAVMLQQPKS